MSERIDARGLSCPQPVVVTRNKMDEIVQGEFEVIVDTATSQDNITRMSKNQGWLVDVKEDGDDFILTIKKP